MVSRFEVLRFREYTREEFMEVAVNVLQKREKVGGELAAYVAGKVWDELESRDVREAVRIARMVRESQSRGEVDKYRGDKEVQVGSKRFLFLEVGVDFNPKAEWFCCVFGT